ncbi:MAG: IS66 family transposase [Terriglobia bacterium]
MRAATSASKSQDELLAWGRADLPGLVNYTLGLQAELASRRDAQAQNSTNSSRPPSTDREQPKPKSLRKKSGRKAGGQPGHPGRTLQFSDQPKHIEIHRLRECECGEDLSKVPAIDFERRQVFDLPSLTLECSEHRGEIKECSGCHELVSAPFPADVNAPVQYGKNFRVLLGYLYDAQLGTSRRIRQMGEEMFGYPVSEGTLQSARQDQYQALEPFEQRLAEILPREPVLNVDETGLPIDKVTHWLHVICTPLLTFFSVQLRRGKAAIDAIGIITQFTGWLVHDFLSSYLSFENCLHSFCKSHLMRELVFLFEQHAQSWAKDLYDLFLEMLRSVQEQKARDAPVSPAQYKRWQQRYRQLLRAGRQANPLTAEQKARRRRKQSKEQNLLDRLEGYEEFILAFLWAWELPFTNNQAERDFRFMKTRIKISGCFRTLEGACRHARIRSYIGTLRKHGLPVLEYLRRALEGRPFLPESSKTT